MGDTSSKALIAEKEKQLAAKDKVVRAKVFVVFKLPIQLSLLFVYQDILLIRLT